MTVICIFVIITSRLSRIKLNDRSAYTYFFSDGILSPLELVYRAKRKCYTAIVLTGRIDYSNVGTVIAGITKVAKIPMENYAILVLSGAELTYIPPKLIKDAADKCRKLGGEITIVHGETIAETVTPKTNIYTVEAGVNILAHPGHLPEEEAGIATENSAKIEITSRRGHDVTNNEVAEVVLKKSKTCFKYRYS